MQFLKALSSEGWCLSENTFKASIDKLIEPEPEILNQQKETELTKASKNGIKVLQERLKLKKGKKRGGGGQGKGNGHDISKRNSPINKEGYYFCGTCNRRHNNTYNKLIEGAN